MRWLINCMTCVMVAVIVVAAIGHQRAIKHDELKMRTVHHGLDQFGEQLALQGVLWQSENEEAGAYPPQVMPEWFNQNVPNNPFLSEDRPWIDIAPADDYNEHPPDPLVDAGNQAAFWYNPNNGIVRARVPRQVSDRLTLSLYNSINHTGLSALPHDNDPDRVPLAFNPNPVTTGRHASPYKLITGRVTAMDSEAAPDDAESSAAKQDQVPWYEKRVVPEEPVETVTEVETESDQKRPSLLGQ